MTALQVIEKDVLIDTLIAFESPINVFPIRDLVPYPGVPNSYQIFWEHVSDGVDLPYIVVSHMMGGRYQGTAISQSYSDTTWKVVMHTADMTIAERASNAISMLGNRCAVTSRYTGVSGITTIQEVMPVFDRYVVQNIPQFMVGGLYRLRLNLGEN